MYWVLASAAEWPGALVFLGVTCFFLITPEGYYLLFSFYSVMCQIKTQQHDCILERMKGRVKLECLLRSTIVQKYEAYLMTSCLSDISQRVIQVLSLL